MCQRYDTSVGVAREALTRLASERLVAFRSKDAAARFWKLPFVHRAGSCHRDTPNLHRLYKINL
nr:hypothetical protein [Nocardia wallacei]